MPHRQKAKELMKLYSSADKKAQAECAIITARECREESLRVSRELSPVKTGVCPTTLLNGMWWSSVINELQSFKDLGFWLDPEPECIDD